ncbi:TPR repeat-containing protein NMB0313 precursor [Suttonella ornithocola]|uniref:TPR repeat-containing protein NMB0313 n=2 Tax=Suttonella ornithocola TaxID=279832 RepID=A0A380MPM3_9GAMM|nr:TPR repeat-containing protein NMB0313 precursor [Suttonella ornithocola]
MKILPLFFIPAVAFSANNIATPDTNYNLNRQQLAQSMSEQPASKGKTINLTSEELLQQPKLLERVLDSSISLGNVEAVEKFLPLYEQLPKKNPILVAYARAMLARVHGNIKESIDYLRQIIADNPELTPVRLQLATALAQDRQIIAAQDQFEKVKSAPNLPPEIAQQVDAYQDYLKRADSWDISGNIRYLSENNVNNAPKNRTYGRWTLPAAESAHGIGYQLGVGKTYGFADNWAWKNDVSIYGKTYWDNHVYDDLIVRLSSGPLYRDALKEIAVAPYFEYRRYGGESYSRGYGISTDISAVLNPQWQNFSALQVGLKRYNHRPHLNGNSLFFSNTVLYRHNPKQSFYGGLDLSWETAKDKSDAYKRIGVRIGWEQEWAKGISSNLQLGAAYRHYDGKDFLQIQRADREYSANISLWNRAWHYHGLTPRLTWQLTENRSNHPMYRYGKNQVFLQVSKKF